jgi:hypothetical protein
MSGEADYLINRDGKIYPLTSLGLSLTGLGDIPIDYQTARGYGQHGTTVLGWRLNPRTISLSVQVTGRTRADYLAKRRKLIEVLNPITGPVTLRRVLPDGSRRDIDGWVQSGLDLAETDDRLSFQGAVSLECPDPAFYDPTLHQTPLAVGYPDQLSFPASFGSNRFYFDSPGVARGTVVNLGSWYSWPLFSITGPYESLVVRNVTTGASFTLGVGIEAGDTLLIDLTPGNVRVENALGDNLLNYRTEGTFTDWYLKPGSNDVRVSGSGTDTSTAFILAYYDRYIAL